MKKWALSSVLILCIGIQSRGAENIQLKSNRVLLIIADQWKDPASYIIQDGE